MSQLDNRRHQPPSQGNGGTPPAGARPDPKIPARKPAPVYRSNLPGSDPQTRNFATDLAKARIETETRRRRVRMALLTSAGTGFIAALVVFLVVSQVFSQVAGIFQPHVDQRPGPNSGPDANGSPIPVSIKPWDQKEPINILLIGLDERTGDQDSRADTQIIVHIDPVAKTAAMVSIPRDLWVDIPGYGPDRINSAYQKGETDKAKVPGGGPVLAMATVQDNFGVTIQYYAQVNFRGFEQIVDTVGGVNIDVPKPLVDNDFPFLDYGSTRVYIPGGLQHMDGRTALEYARSRHADSDIGRNSRQQQVLLALKQKGVSFDLLGHAGELSQQLSKAIHTDLTLEQVLSLAQLARGIDSSAIKSVAIDAGMINETIQPDGADVLVPRWEIIRPKIAELFADPLIGQEAARLSVLNGTTTNGAGRKVRDALAVKGLYIANLDVAPDQGSHPTTTITDYTRGAKPHTIETLTTSLGIPASSVKQAPPKDAPTASDGSPVDILLVVGDDQIGK